MSNKINNPVKLDIQLRLADTDSLGHINNAAYIEFIETARTEWQAIVKKSRLEIDNWDWILGEIKMKFIAVGYLTDEIKIKMWCSRIGTKSWDFSYLISNQNGTIANAQTTQIAYDYSNRKSQIIPSYIKQDLESRIGNPIYD